MTNIPAYCSDILLQTEDKCIIILLITRGHAESANHPPKELVFIFDLLKENVLQINEGKNKRFDYDEVIFYL